MYESADVVKDLLHYERRILPNEANVEFYDRYLPLYEQAYTSLVDFYQKLDQFTNTKES
jgi:sugar (pentulose or hexulose) kinase